MFFIKKIKKYHPSILYEQCFQLHSKSMQEQQIIDLMIQK